jgi:hypothetical protein
MGKLILGIFCVLQLCFIKYMAQWIVPAKGESDNLQIVSP